VGAFLESHPGEVNPTVAGLIVPGGAISAADAFRGQYRLAELRRQTQAIWDTIDVLLLPTAPHAPTLAELDADPLLPNARNGLYTTFVNLLDLAGIALPAGFRADGVPFGIQLIAPAQTDRALLDLAEGWSGTIEIAVVGAHLAGQPLHHELGGAPLVRMTRTAANYRLFALDTVPPKPGLVRVEGSDTAGAAPVEVEIYALDPAAFGRFVAGVPAPLSIGTLLLEDGSAVKGFLCEPAALVGAREITGFGGWRNYLANGQA
jgi:allophanate hydrolase